MLLARGISRQQELTVRAALGARRSRLVRLLLVESSLLALGGGMLGALVARWAIVAFLATNPEPPPYWVTFEVGGTGILFVLGVCVLATLACG
ncbi:MAG TPA: FtsX-like permease family protein, partial [Thermoanaerobaculia bacterium]|nr:FtsX-like permease family protein [Thermoanaerobaculia bacterium]